MQIRPDAPKTPSLSQISSSDQGTVRFSKGEIIQAVVDRQIRDGLFLISVRGMKIEASTVLELSPGQSLVLRSEGQDNGATILKVLQPEEAYSSKIADHLQEIGMRTNEQLLAVADKLLKYGMAVSRDNVEAVMTRLRLLEGFSSQNLETAVWSLGAGLKSEKELLMALKQFLSNPTLVKPTIEHAVKLLQGEYRTETSMTSDSPVRSPSSNLASTDSTSSMSKRLILQEESIPLQPAYTILEEDTPASGTSQATRGVQPADQASQNLKSTSQGQGILSGETPVPIRNETALPNTMQTTSQERMIQLEGMNPGPLTELAPSGGAQTMLQTANLSYPAELNELLTVLRTVIDTMTARGAEAPSVIAHDLQSNLSGQKDLLQIINTINSVLAEVRTEESSPLENAHKLFQAVQAEVMGQAAFNSADRLSPIFQPGGYFFALPVSVDGQDHLVQLKILRDERGSRRLNEMDEIRLAISLDTANLGMVVFHLRWLKNQGVTIQGAVNQEETKELILNEFPDLQKRLNDGGFQVNFLGIKVAALEERIRPSLEPEGSEPKFIGIDIHI